MRTLIRGVRVFDGTTTTERADVLIDGDRIAAPDDAPVDAEIDGTGKTLLPGLIDAHTHVFDGDLAQALAFGVTTELDMFCLPANLARQRRAADRDDAADLRSAATLATAPGGHPSQIMTSPEMRTRDFGDAAGPFDTVRGPQQAEAFVQARLAEGADYLKIVIDSGTASGAPLPVLTLQTATALVEAAHAAGLRVIAHAVTVDDTLTYFEALTGTGEDRELLRDERIRSRLPAHLRSAADRDTDAIPVHAHGAPNAVHAARTLHDAGVRLLADTDANPFAPLHGAGLHRELLLLTLAGLTPAQALAAATSTPADCFGLSDRGRIAPGLRADLLLVDGDPTRDITATRAIADVWRRGVRQPRRD